MEGIVYLWLNLTDLDELGTIGPLGSPLMLMVNQQFGDNLLGAVLKANGALDDTWAVVECTTERAAAIRDGIEVVAQRKLSRPMRTKITKRPPGPGWRWA